MATATRDVPFTKSAYAKQTSPNTVFPTNSSTAYSVSTDDGNSNSYKSLFFGGANVWPEELKRNKLLSAAMRIYVKVGYPLSLSAMGCDDFTPSEVTYNNRPSTGTSAYASLSYSDAGSPGSWVNAWMYFDRSGGASGQANAAAFLLKKGAVKIEGGYWTSNLSDSPWSARTVLSNNAAAFLRIEYDDSTIITSKVQFYYDRRPLPTTADPKSKYTVQWGLVKNSNYRCADEVWTQASASFLWQVNGASSWNEIPADGSQMSLTIPAYTFPTGKTIKYKVRCTDTDGTTTETDVYTTTTPASQITQQNCPTSGYKNPREAIPFSWYFTNISGITAQQSASLFWRETGEENWTEIQASGSTMSVTVPANTFPTASTIEWYLYGTDYSGSSSQTPVYSFSTSASLITAVCKTPVSSVEDGSAAIRFIWELWSGDGYEASRTVFEWKKASDSDIPANWHTEMDVAQTVTDISVLGGTFPAGEIDWKVCAYNIDGTEGVWGSASFICVDAPDPVLGLAATPVPLTTISWQSSEQEAYEISIDGKVVKKSYGPSVYSWTVPEPLPAGEHVITVRVQGIYSLWSQPSETSIQIGGPAADLELAGAFGVDALLSCVSGTPDAVIRYYRDGVLIGTAPEGVPFTDRRALGTHDYFARRFVGDGTYEQSNTVTGRMSTTDTLIAALDGGEWVSMRLTDASRGSESFTWSKTVARMHVAGSAYPVLETSPYEDLSGSYSCAFRYDDEARAFEALRGKVVILKSRRDNVVVGALAQLQKKVRRFFVSYSFTIQQTQWEDFVAYDAGD